MTTQEKAGQTNHEHKEQDRQRFRDQLDDKEKALAVARAIRDNPDAADSDRLEAIRIISTYTD